MSEPADSWPSPVDSGDATLHKEIFAGRLELRKQQRAAQQAIAQADSQAELDSKTEFYKSIFEIAKGSIDRAQTGAQAIQTAAGAIVTLYTGLLAVTFAAASRPLPARGVVPAVLLGCSVVFASAYLAYLRNSDDSTVPAPVVSSSLRSNEWARARFYIEWTRSTAAKRGYWLRSSVLAFGFAIMLLPAPFLAVGRVDLGIVAFGKATPKSASVKADWPPVPKARRADLQLQKIRYAAEVKEAATARSGNSGVAKDGNDVFWYALGGLALALSLIPLIRRTGTSEPPPSPYSPTPSTSSPDSR
jgi:hypothetical protein